MGCSIWGWLSHQLFKTTSCRAGLATCTPSQKARTHPNAHIRHPAPLPQHLLFFEEYARRTGPSTGPWTLNRYLLRQEKPSCQGQQVHAGGNL